MLRYYALMAIWELTSYNTDTYIYFYMKSSKKCQIFQDT